MGSADESVNYIGIDNARSIYTSVKYLIDLGHKRIGFLVGPMTCARRTIDRMEGYKKVLADNGIPFDPELIRSQPPSYLLGKESMRAFLKLQDPPDGVLCVNDYLAIGAIRCHHRGRGLSVPGGHFGLRLRRHRHRRLLQPAADEHQDALLRNGPDGGEHHDLGH